MNFKSLLLTIVAALGLAASVQACKDCLWKIPGSYLFDEKSIEYARKNADILWAEYQQTLNSKEFLTKSKTKILESLTAIHNFEIAILKSTAATAQEFFADKENLKLFDACQQASSAFLQNWIDASLPQQTAPHLNMLAQLLTQKQRQQQLTNGKQTRALKGEEEHTQEILSKPAHIKEQLLNFELKEAKPRLVAQINSICTSNLFYELGKASYELLKDDLFFAEIAKEVPGHKIPQTKAFIKYQAITKQLFDLARTFFDELKTIEIKYESILNSQS